jgi:hypothetical protein
LWVDRVENGDDAKDILRALSLGRDLRAKFAAAGVGGLCHYVLAKWATEGSGALLEIGPTMVRRLAAICEDAEAAGTDEARLDAYRKLQGLVSWLRFPLDHPEVYPEHAPGRGRGGLTQALRRARAASAVISSTARRPSGAQASTSSTSATWGLRTA